MPQRRLVITVPLDDDITDGPGLGELITSQVIPDLARMAGNVTGELGELKPGQYGFTTDPGTHAVRLHWAIRQEG
jgi:hypothetical protein